MAVHRSSAVQPARQSVGGASGPPLLHYVTLREGEEQAALADLQVVYDHVRKTRRVQWRDPVPLDWDARDVLWVRIN